MSRLSEHMKKRKQENDGASNLFPERSKKTSKLSQHMENRRKTELANSINFNTFRTDLATLSKTIGSAYNGWQTPETMSNTLSSVQSMYDRLGKYQEYQKRYGGTDLSKLQSAYKSVLDGWDDLSNFYGAYKNADAFNASKKIALMDKDYTGLTFDEVQAKKSEYVKDSFEYKYFDNYTKYTDLNEFDKAIEAQKNGNKSKTKSATSNPEVFKLYPTNDTQPTSFLDAVNKSKTDELFKPYDFETISNEEYYEGLVLKGRDLETERNKRAIEHKAELYNYVTQNADYAETSVYNPTQGGSDIWKKYIKGTDNEDYRNLVYEYINGSIVGKNNETAASSAYHMVSTKNYDKLYDNEKGIFNYLYEQDKQNGTNTAIEFLDDMQITLDSRVYREKTEKWSEMSESPILATLNSVASIPASVLGAIPTVVDAGIDAIKGKPYNPYSSAKSFTNFAQDTRKYVGENIAKATPNVEFIGQNVPSFLYQTGMSLADNLVGASTLKTAYLPMMSTNAFHQTAKEMTEAGEDTATVYAMGLASAAAEMVFEKISLDRFLKIKGVDSKMKIVTDTLKQAGVEASEEFFTEISNLIADDAIRGADSELRKKHQDFLARGYSVSEADTEIAKQIGSQIGWAAVGGGLSGGAMGFVGATGNYLENSSKGQDIRGNERVTELFDIASNPEAAQAYEAYTEYANKGINADNVKNAQLGRLYTSVKSGAMETLASKEITAEQKTGAMQTLARLSVVDTENTVAKRVKELNVGEETKVTKSGETAKIEGIKVTKEGTSVMTDSGEISVDDITLSQNDSELVAYAEQITKEQGEDIGNLFISQYDGETDIDKYANSFNLTMAYAKDNFPHQTLLENKGSLTTSQVTAIYQATVINQAKEKDAELQQLTEKQGKTMFVQGVFDDSILDRNNATTDGSKVNWNTLTYTQRSAIKFMQLFTKATGVNIKLIKSDVVDGKHKGKNGSYDPNTNIIEIDIYAGRVDAHVLNDAIIPTLSHEMTHWMKVKSPLIYNSIKDDIIETLANNSTMTSAEIINAELNRLNKAHPDKEHTADEAVEELVARACEDMLSNSKSARELLNKMSAKEQQSFIDKVKETFENLIQWVNDFLASYKSDSAEAKVLREYKDMLKKVSKQWDAMLVQAIERNQALEKSSEVKRKDDVNVKHDDRVISVNMSEDERYEILKNNVIKLAEVDTELYKKYLEQMPELLNKEIKLTVAKKLLKKIGDEFGVFKEYESKDFNIKFEFGKGNLGESVQHQKGNYEIYAQMLSCFSDVISNAVGIEVHNRNEDGYKPDFTLKNVYVLCSAFENNTDIIPVKLSVKEFSDKANRLYIAVALEGIKKDRVESMGVQDNLTHIHASPVTISIKDIFENVNIKDGDFLKYIPNQFLNNEQIKAKEQALEMERKKYYGDIRNSDRGYSYENLVSKPDMKLTVLNNNVPNNRADIIYQAKKNAAKIGKINANDKTISVFVDDINRDIVIGTEGLKHGLRRLKNIQTDANSFVTLKAGEIIKNSILINELIPKRQNVDGSYVLVGAAKSLDDDLYIVQSVINQYSNELMTMDVLYAINTKKENRLRSMRPEILPSVTDSTISIADLLDYVNKYFPDVTPENVWRHYGHNERPDGELGKSALYSDREEVSIYDLMGETERLNKENESLRADIERLNERLKIEKKVTHGNYFNENQLGAVAGHLRNISKSNMDKLELMKALKDVYSYIAHSSELTWEDVFSKCSVIADRMIAESKPEKVINDYSKHILNEIRSKRVSFSEAQKNEAQYIFGKNWNRSFFGRVTITDDGISLENQWREWSERYPSIFDANITDADMPAALYDILGNLKDASEIVVEYDLAERTRWLATEIYNQYWNVSALKTTADKYDNRIKRLNYEHRNAMTKLRDSFDTKLKAQVLADDIYYAGKLGEQKTKYEGKLAESKAQIEKQKELYKNLRDHKDKQIAEAKQKGKERLDKYKENAERKTCIQRITANALTLNTWLKKNSKDYHIHEAMKGPVIKLLNAIDFSSKRMLENGDPTQKDISFAEAFSDVKSMLENADNMVEGLEPLYGHDLAESIKLLSEGAFNLIGDNSYVINAMTNEQLFHLDKLVREIKKTVTDLNKFHIVNHNQGAVDLAHEFVEHGYNLGKLKKQHGKAGKFLEFRNRTPYYFFKDLGKVGVKLFEAFQDGWDKLAFNAKKIIDFTEKTYTDEEVKQWSKETKEFTLSQPDGSERTFEMSIAQIMALHCVSKQEDAQTHLVSGGMTLKRLDKKGHVITDYDNINLTYSDIKTILDTLTDRQREVADKLQKFMNTVCSEWGNEISMARFGVKMFDIPDYFPIKVSEATVPTDNTKDVDNVSLWRLLIMSFTKARNQNAEQSIEIGDIFDVFAQHSSDMAKYNALALPVLDFNKFYSIHGRDMNGNEYGVVQTLQSVFGDEANGYLRRFVRDLNGSQNVSRDVIGNTFFKNAKVASVAANLRVVILQPTAFHKASAVMDMKYLTKASAYIKVEPVGMVKKLKKAVANAEKYCGIIQWKALGYYDTDISKGLTEKIKHSGGVKDKLIEKSLKGAEIADKVTFGTLWVACEFEIRDTRKDLKVGSDEFYNAIAKRLRDVIYATQVVDSTMTRSDMMRSSDGKDKMLTAFGSEPTIAYNMLLDMVTQYKRDKQEFGDKEAKKRNAKKIRKVVTAYVITNAVAALVESGFDVLRDDEDDEMDMAEFLKLYFKNFAFDMSIGNKLPFVKELYSTMQGYSSSRMDTQWLMSVNYAIKDFSKIIEGKGDWEKFIKDFTKAMSYMSGLPFYNIYRDAKALLDKLGIMDD